VSLVFFAVLPLIFCSIAFSLSPVFFCSVTDVFWNSFNRRGALPFQKETAARFPFHERVPKKLQPSPTAEDQQVNPPTTNRFFGARWFSAFSPPKLRSGLPDFSCYNLPKWEKYTK
jgi:hypothetical protein